MSSGDNYVFSTATASINFAEYTPPAKNRVPRILRKVTILGGANVAVRKTLVTPRGVATKVSDDDLQFLLANHKFVKMAREGFFSISNRQDDLDKAVKDMKAKDRSAPKTPADFTGKTTAGAAAT